MSKVKAPADNKINVTLMSISVSDRVGNIVGKGENAGYQHSLLFACFEKASFPGMSKGVILWEWVNASAKSILPRAARTVHEVNYCPL